MVISANVQTLENRNTVEGLAVREPGTGYKTRRYLHSLFDPSSSTLWTAFDRNGPARMTAEVIGELKGVQEDVQANAAPSPEAELDSRIRYQVLASEIPGIFNLGGDLDYISSLIKNRDRKALRSFARDCVELIFRNSVSYNLPITTISLVQGTALGGGFEAALSANVVIAETQSRWSLPEVMFNMFPGMGAYQLLCRRVPPAVAEKIILSGKTYEARELHDMGVIDVLAEPGEGEEAVWTYIKRHKAQSNAEWSFRRMVNDTSQPVRLEDLYTSAEHWVNTALQLDDNDLKHMDFVIRLQKNTKLRRPA